MALPRGVCGSTSVGPNAQLLQHLPRITRCLAAASDARSCLRRRLPSRQAAAEVDRLMIRDMQLREFWRCVEIGQVPPQRRFHSRCGADHVTNRRSTAERLRWSISGETNWRRIPTTTFDCRPKGLMTPPVPSCSCRLCHCFHWLRFIANDGRTFRMPAPRDRQYNRRDASRTWSLPTGKPPCRGFSPPSDFNPMTWSGHSLCCLAQSEVRA
jgi:hypothetical protein